jgi:hypothetical protein
MRAAPHLLTARMGDVACSPLEARSLLRNEPPFGPLRMQRLSIDYGTRDDDDVVDEPPMPAVVADLTAHPSVVVLRVYSARMDAPGAWAAVADAALAQRLHTLKLLRCRARPGAAAALTRLLSSTTLTELMLAGHGAAEELLLDTPAGAAAMAGALRANTTLTSLYIDEVQLWRDAADASAVLGALTGHPSLCSLQLHTGHLLDHVEVGQAFAALVLANAPTLRELAVGCGGGVAGNAGLGVLFDALAHNTHLQTFMCRDDGLTESDTLLTERLMPALRANRSLRRLMLGWHATPTPAMGSAMMLVAGRAAPADA